MMYLRDEDLARANDDLRAFVKWALEGGTARRAATQ
jgi:hypothetical protein